MKVKQLIDYLHYVTGDQIDKLVAVEMPDDKSQYAVQGIRFDESSDSFIIEVA
jgi:hypothetical protein